MPQRLGLMDELSAQENVEYPARIAGELDERRQLIDDLIETLGLATLRPRYPKETSLGEQQRVALARASCSVPRLLIADEPTGHQDAGWASRIMWTLRSAAAAGSCCVIATHDRELIDQLDRAVLDVGRQADELVDERRGRTTVAHAEPTGGRGGARCVGRCGCRPRGGRDERAGGRLQGDPRVGGLHDVSRRLVHARGVVRRGGRSR